jgi:hypothetical protein
MSYTKNHETWAVTDPITAEAMNHLESQWTSIKSLIDVHNHDTRYYSKTAADAKFFSTSWYAGCDADMVDGLHLNDIITTVMPIGAIMAWPGTDGDVPAGWYVCDGASHGGHVTMNLIDYFIIGAGGDYDLGDTDGPGSWNGTITPTGSITVGDHILTEAELPAHTHDYTEKRNAYAVWLPNTGIYSITGYQSTTAIGEQATGDGAHNHTSGSSITFNSIDPRPAYYAIYFIEKCE